MNINEIKSNSVWKEWRSGYWRSRGYDDYNEISNNGFDAPDPEPPFYALIGYLSSSKIDYDTLSSDQKLSLVNLVKSISYYDDGYYRSDEMVIHYIPYEKLNHWIIDYRPVSMDLNGQTMEIGGRKYQLKEINHD